MIHLLPFYISNWNLKLKPFKLKASFWGGPVKTSKLMEPGFETFSITVQPLGPHNPGGPHHPSNNLTSPVIILFRFGLNVVVCFFVKWISFLEYLFKLYSWIFLESYNMIFFFQSSHVLEQSFAESPFNDSLKACAEAHALAPLEGLTQLSQVM